MAEQTITVAGIDWNPDTDNQGRPIYRAKVGYRDFVIKPLLDRCFRYTEFICTFRSPLGTDSVRGTVSEVMEKIAKITTPLHHTI
jgi:hypothetical protein